MYGGVLYGGSVYGGSYNNRKIWYVNKSTSTADAKGIDWQTLWTVNKSNATAQGFPISFTIAFVLGKSSATSQAFSVTFEPIGSAVFAVSKSEASAQAFSIRWSQTYEIAKSTATANANAIDWLTKWAVALSNASSSANPVVFDATGTVSISVAKSTASAQAFQIDLVYAPITVVPELAVSRSSDKTQITVDRTDDANQSDIDIYLASDYLAEFTLDSSHLTVDLPVTITGLTATSNYMVRASYSIVGTKGGSPYSVSGNLSQERSTIGKNRRI